MCSNGSEGRRRTCANGADGQGQGRSDLARQISAGKTGGRSPTVIPDGPLEAGRQTCFKQSLISPVRTARGPDTFPGTPAEGGGPRTRRSLPRTGERAARGRPILVRGLLLRFLRARWEHHQLLDRDGEVELEAEELRAVPVAGVAEHRADALKAGAPVPGGTPAAHSLEGVARLALRRCDPGLARAADCPTRMDCRLRAAWPMRCARCSDLKPDGRIARLLPRIRAIDRPTPAADETSRCRRDRIFSVPRIWAAAPPG